MAKRDNNRTVYPTPEGWANKRNGASKSAPLQPTQREAENAAREMLKRSGGGELTTIGRDHLIRSKDTIGSKDPNPPKDREH
jgi:hypothetical protein